MRALFLFLVLANLAFFAWMTMYSPESPGTDTSPMRSQIDPGKVQVLPVTGTTVTPVPAPPPKPKPEPGTAAAPATCVEWGSFTVADAPAAEKALEPLAIGARLSQRRVEETAGWWVYMPPQGNRANAQKKTAELKAMGIEDWFIIADEGRWRWAVSLGVFRTEAAATNRLEALRARGVRTALVGERELQVPKIWLQVRNLDPVLLARWREIAQAYAVAEFRDCPP